MTADIKYLQDEVIDAFLRVRSGSKKVEVETERGSVVKAYQVGDIIRIDIKEAT